jgi:hypothetical protein
MFYTQFDEFIQSFSPRYIFVADETMVDAAKGAKCITPRGGSLITVDFKHFPHVSAMCANNLTGIIIPPFMILPHDASAMHEFDDIVAANRAWICMTQNACQTRKSFLILTICFCNWLIVHRITNQMTAENSDCLLIVDGHTSPACPLALEIFRYFRIHALALPSHPSHICQFFDVGLANVLKRAIKSHLQRLARIIRHIDFPNETRKVRWLFTNALIDAWHQILTLDYVAPLLIHADFSHFHLIASFRARVLLVHRLQ